LSLPILPSPLGPTTPPTGQPSQQGQPTTRRNYLVIPLVLQPQMEIDVNGDWLSVLSYQADLDLSNVYVAFNYADNWLPLSAIGAGVFTPFERIYIRAAQSEVGKSLSVAIGGQARFYISAQGVTISNDLVGLAREYTLAQIATSAAGIYSIASSNINYPMNQLRWGYPVEPIWTYSPVSTGPLAAGTVLLSQPVSPGYNAYIWGYFLSENDPNGNTFLVQWVNGTTVYQQMVVMNGPGTINFISVKAINDGIPASPNTTMAVKILNAASTNALYMAGILYGQVP